MATLRFGRLEHERPCWCTLCEPLGDPSQAEQAAQTLLARYSTEHQMRTYRHNRVQVVRRRGTTYRIDATLRQVRTGRFFWCIQFRSVRHGEPSTRTCAEPPADWTLAVKLGIMAGTFKNIAVEM